MSTLGEIVSNEQLADAVLSSVQTGLDHSLHLAASTSTSVVQSALNAAIRDINEHQKGRLFQRFLEYGPFGAGDSVESAAENCRELDDTECGTCIEFIHSHMVNRFKGELAELLAIEPCVRLIGDLRTSHVLPEDVEVYFGDTIQERRRVRGEWGKYAKGADGLIVRFNEESGDPALELHGVVEVKSMYRSRRKLDAQIESHASRLRGGVRLSSEEWPSDRIVDRIGTRISVLPANWRLGREFTFEETETGRRMVFPERSGPNVSALAEEVSPGRWTITLAWSQEALEEAAYEMTFWYMGQVGDHVFARSNLPRSWSDMTYEGAGRNSLKMMLYHTMLRPLSERHARLAAKLYNVYCFGYPIGIDSKEMLWPEDLK